MPLFKMLSSVTNECDRSALHSIKGLVVFQYETESINQSFKIYINSLVFRCLGDISAP